MSSSEDRFPVQNPSARRAGGWSALILLFPILCCGSFFTIGGANLVATEGEWYALPFVVGTGYTQLSCGAIVVSAWAVIRTQNGSPTYGYTVSASTVRRVHGLYGWLYRGALGVLTVLVLCVPVGALHWWAGGGDDLVLLLLLLTPTFLMIVLTAFMARAVHRLRRTHEQQFPGLREAPA